MRGSVTPGMDGIRGGKEIPSGSGDGKARATVAKPANESLLYMVGDRRA